MRPATLAIIALTLIGCIVAAGLELACGTEE
jgi:hypothetical protein